MHMLTFKNALHLVPLALIIFGLAGYNFMNANWTSPTGVPPLGNVPAPINQGTSTESVQAGLGILGFDRLVAFDRAYSDKYCNLAGDSCFSSGDVVSSSTELIELGTIFGETGGYTLQAQNLCTASGYHGVWQAIDRSGPEDIICFRSKIIGRISEVQTFVSAYFALRSDPSFMTFWGSSLPHYEAACAGSVTSLLYCGTGWRSFGVLTTGSVRLNTYDKICSYMMVNGRFKTGSTPTIFDSGSDNDNRAVHWTGSGTGMLLHQNNNVDDTTVLTCIGDRVSTQGTWWLKSSRLEVYSRSGNKYPIPPVR